MDGLVGEEVGVNRANLKSLFKGRYRWNELPRSDGSGVYAYFLADSAQLPAIHLGPSRLLYVGMTESSLDARCHFTHLHSGFSTFRRSLGAILKGPLTLRAIPRASGPSKTNTTNFRFDPDGEARLTAWMQENLLYSHEPLIENIASTEADLIKELEPSLNLTGWKNPQKQAIRRLRRACADEARGSA